MKKLLYTLALIGATFTAGAQSLTIINNTGCTLVCSASGKNCTACGCLSIQTNQFSVSASSSVTFSSMVSVNTGIGWSRGGPATGAAGCAWELVKVGTPSCSALVAAGSCYTATPVSLPCCSATATWSNVSGNITVTVN